MVDEAGLGGESADQDDERVFAEQLRALEHDAWARLFDEHRDKIWRYALARTGRRDDADDLTSQVFLEALNSIHRYRYTGKPVLAWLYGIARNHAGKLLRQRSRQAPLPDPEAVTGPDDVCGEELDLGEALRTLTRDQREVITLRFFAGYSTREIARALGKSEPAVYSLEVRAIGALRRRLGTKSEDLSTEADKTWASRGIEE